jgi:uncharacterized membrane protein YqjE
MTDAEEKDQGLLWVVGAGAVGLLVLGFVYYRFRTLNHVWTLADHANLGNALAPAVAFLTLLAVISALWSVQIQRTELALQRKELQSTREEMVEQRKQFERTAEAQEALAKSQAGLAEGQRIANNIEINNVQRLLGAEHAQRMSNVATLMASIANVTTAVETGRNPMGGKSMGEEALGGVVRALQEQRDREVELVFDLERLMKETEIDA